MFIPWECSILENDLFEYRRAMQRFENGLESINARTGEQLTLEEVIEDSKLPRYERRKLPKNCNYDHYIIESRYLANSDNDLLKDFKGDYIGNILKLTDKGYEACIVTKHQKSGQSYRLYTLVDLKGVNISEGCDICYDEDRDGKYFERLRSADKTPTFVTRVDKDGKEEIILYKNQPITGECPEYKEFAENYIAPFEEIKLIQIGNFLNKKTEKTK